MFFFANKEVSVAEADFWEKSYLIKKLQHGKLDTELSSTNYAGMPASNKKKEMGMRDSISSSSTIQGKEQSIRDCPACPLFIKDLAKSIVSAGKSLQLMRHVPTSLAVRSKRSNFKFERTQSLNYGLSPSHRVAGLTLSEIFSVSLAGLIGHGDHVCKYFWQDDWHESVSVSLFASYLNRNAEKTDNENLTASPHSEKIWYKFLIDTLFQKGSVDLKPKYENDGNGDSTGDKVVNEESFPLRSCLQNPVITVSRKTIGNNGDALKTLNLSQNFCLPSLNDAGLRKAIFGAESTSFSDSEGTNYSFGFQYDESKYLHSHDTMKLLEMLFPFPTILPSVQVFLLTSLAAFGEVCSTLVR
jgi:gamma-tubulin complex component 5